MSPISPALDSSETKLACESYPSEADGLELSDLLLAIAAR
jgi:hypothetical protein